MSQLLLIFPVILIIILLWVMIFKTYKRTDDHKGMVDYASMERRLAAGYIDMSIVSSIWYGLVGLLCVVFPVSKQADGGDSMGMATFILLLVMYILYNTILESSIYQATLGKLTLGIIATDMRGNRLSFGHALQRNITKWGSIFSWGIGFLMMLFTDKSQTLHELWNKTLVLRRQK